MRLEKFSSVARVAFYAVVATCVLVAAIAVGNLVGLLDVSNPFKEKRSDRTGPSVLVSLTSISEYHAAKAYYETVVDIEDDTAHLPDWVSGERVLYVGKGTVDGLVDFSNLDEDHVVVSEDHKFAAIHLPEPSVGEPVLDLEDSYVVEHSKGLADKFSGSELEGEAQLKAVKQMSAAASSADNLMDLAKANTEAMLRGLLGALGYSEITVTFGEVKRNETPSDDASEENVPR